MYINIRHSPRTRSAVLAAFVVLVAMLTGLQLEQAAPARAETASTDAVFGFCENVQLPGNGFCNGEATGLYQTYGWGDQHSVCVDVRPWPGVRRCSSGPGAGVYSGEIPANNAGTPWIENNAAGANYVHGVYFTH